MAEPYNPQDHWYPKSITDWELRHGIVRCELDGGLVVSSPIWKDTNASIDKEQNQVRTKLSADKLAKMYADIAAAYYGGKA